MEKKTIVIGQMNNERDHTLESANRVYGKHGCCPTINTCGGELTTEGYQKQVRVIGGTGDMWGDKQFRQQHRVIDKKQVAYAVASGAVVELVVKKYDKNMSLYNSK